MTDQHQAETGAMTWAERTRARLMSTPEGRAALAEAEEREKHLIRQTCREGNCVELIDPLTGEDTGGWGPVGCPCQDDVSSSPASEPDPSDPTDLRVPSFDRVSNFSFEEDDDA